MKDYNIKQQAIETKVQINMKSTLQLYHNCRFDKNKEQKKYRIGKS